MTQSGDFTLEDLGSQLTVLFQHPQTCFPLRDTPIYPNISQPPATLAHHTRKDPDGALLDGDFVPSMSASSSDLVNLAVSRSDGGQTDVKNDSVRADGSSFKFLNERLAISSCKGQVDGMLVSYQMWWVFALLRLCYPSLKQNTSHAELLGGFVDVCSRKIDNTQKVIESHIYKKLN